MPIQQHKKQAHLTADTAVSDILYYIQTRTHAVNSLTATVDPFLPTPPVMMMATLDCASRAATRTATYIGTSLSSTSNHGS